MVQAQLGRPDAPGTGRGGRWVRWAGPVALAAALGLYAVNLAAHPHVLLGDIDLAVYRDAGLVARHSPGQLYRWRQATGLRFTYTPFAAWLCVVASFLPWPLLVWLMLAGSVAALAATVWLVLGALGWHGMDRLGAACAVTAVAFWIEPVQRTLHTGEVDLLLMLLVVRDLTNTGRRWQGTGVGMAAGIKLVALIFIPYLLITGRFRQAGAAAGAFAATVAVGALLLPRASGTWWLGGAFLDADRTGFVGYLPNQSLFGSVTRLAGTVPATAVWVCLAVLAGAGGLVLAALVDRQGWPVHGWVICAITGLVVSPVSWDHAWVWIAPALAVLTDTAVHAQGARRMICWAAAGLVAAVFAAWPGAGPALPWGLIWYAPATGTGSAHPEYHWAGAQLVEGNLYLLAGSALLGAAAVTTAAYRRRRPEVGAVTTAAYRRRRPDAGADQLPAARVPPRGPPIARPAHLRNFQDLWTCTCAGLACRC